MKKKDKEALKRISDIYSIWNEGHYYNFGAYKHRDGANEMPRHARWWKTGATKFMGFLMRYFDDPEGAITELEKYMNYLEEKYPDEDFAWKHKDYHSSVPSKRVE